MHPPKSFQFGSLEAKTSLRPTLQQRRAPRIPEKFVLARSDAREFGWRSPEQGISLFPAL